MSFLKVITGLLLTSIIVTATTCDNKCPRGDLRLDSGSRNWLPLKGKNQLTFTTQSGRTMSCRLKVVDTLQPYSAQVECSGNYFYEYINADLYLNPSGSDSIHCAMASGSQLSLRAGSDKEISMNYGNLLGQYSSTSTLTRFPTLTVGSRTYSNVILAKSMFSNGSTIDSIYIAYSYGPVGFVYNNQKYFLK